LESIIFLSRSDRSACDIVSLNKTNQIKIISEESDYIQKFDRNINETSLEELPSLFKQIYGNEIDLAKDSKEPMELELMASVSSTQLALALGSVFNGPSHILPPPSSFFDTFMDHLLIKNKKEEDNNMILLKEPFFIPEEKPNKNKIKKELKENGKENGEKDINLPGIKVNGGLPEVKVNSILPSVVPSSSVKAIKTDDQLLSAELGVINKYSKNIPTYQNFNTFFKEKLSFENPDKKIEKTENYASKRKMNEEEVNIQVKNGNKKKKGNVH